MSIKGQLHQNKKFKSFVFSNTHVLTDFLAIKE